MELRTDISGWRIRWDAQFASACVASGAWANRTIADFAHERVRRAPEQVLLVDGQGRFTCAALYQQARTLASALQRHGLKPGDVVSFQLPNWHEAHLINLAAAMAGLIIHPLGTIARHAEVQYMLGHCASRMVFFAPSFKGHDYLAMMAQVKTQLSQLEVVVVRGSQPGLLSLDALMSQGDASDPLPQVSPDAIKLIMYTSGTTGRPKGVIHTHNTIHAENHQRTKYLALDERDCVLVPSPVSHITGTIYGLNLPWNCGVPAALVDIWNPPEAFDLALANGCSLINGAPFLRGIVDVARERGQTLPALRYFSLGGAATPRDLMAQAAQLFPQCIVFSACGSTEVPTITPGLADPAYKRQGLLYDGNIGDCEVRLVDAETGRPCAPGEEGELLVKAPQMLVGYTDAQDNESAFTEDGFFKMGDIARIMEGNWIALTGRKKDLIIRLGENLSPKDMEDVIATHAAVAEVAVVAMPDARTGEKACAFVVLKPGSQLDLPEIDRFMTAAGRARQMIPERLEIVGELPRNFYGKVRKAVLRDIARDLANTAGG